MYLHTQQPNALRRLVAALLAMSLVMMACSVATDDVGTEGASAGEADIEPTPTIEPEPVGICGPAAIASPGQTSWEVSTEPVPTEDILELSVAPPSTSFNVSDPVVAPDREGRVYVLGPAWPLEVELIEPVEAFNGRACTLELTLTTSGLATFNDVAGLCFRMAPRCVTGQLAIVVDGEVIAAPTIASNGFTEPTIVISSSEGFDFDEAPITAQQLADGAQFRPVLFERLG